MVICDYNKLQQIATGNVASVETFLCATDAHASDEEPIGKLEKFNGVFRLVEKSDKCTPF